MQTRIRVFPGNLAAVSVLGLIVTGQILSKWGALSPRNPHTGLNLILVISYALFLVRGVLWAHVLRRTRVFVAYTLSSLSYPLILLADLVFFDAELSTGKILGTILIGTGSVLLIIPNRSTGKR